jgi:hypothetical protein
MQRKHNQHCRLLALLGGLAVVWGCGPTRGGDSPAAAPRPGAGSVYDIPGSLAEPPPLSPVPLGSRLVVAEPAGGTPQSGPFLLRLQTEPGATLRRTLSDPDGGGFAAGMWGESAPTLLLVPPVTVWVVAEKDGQGGSPLRLDYPLAPEVEDALSLVAIERLPLEGPAALITPDFAAGAERVRFDVGDEPGERNRVRDGAGDVPSELSAIDIVALTAVEDGDELVVTLETLAAPEQKAGFTYGFEIGPSNVTAAAFGPGATYAHRVEAAGFDASVRYGTSSLRWRVPLAELKALDGEAELVARGFTAADVAGTTVTDRTEALYLRSRFVLQRTAVSLAGGTLELDLRVEPDDADSPFVVEYAALAETLLPELERASGIAVAATRTIPLAVVAEENAGYTGLNTSDRGVVTTLGPQASLLARTQLLVHELAHYQNARFSQLSSRWLQEGMSEWIAERMLYRHFPARAVHRFLEGLRFARLREAVASGLDDFALGEWAGSTDSLGYEKSLAFLDLLAVRLGEEALRKAFARAVSVPMDDEAFARFLTQETGEDVLGLYAYWVRPGSPVDEAADPRALLSDLDGDDLTSLDEALRGSDPGRFDTDGDGVPDGEEVFAGESPSVAAEPATPSETSPLTRLRSEGGEYALYYSLIPGDASPDRAYEHPLFLRPPYELTVKNGADMTIVSRPLYVDDQAVDIPPAAGHILPATPRNDWLTETGIVASAAGAAFAVMDFAADIPSRVAAWDITGMSLGEGDDWLTVRVATLAPPAFHGEHGDYVLTFERISWSATGPQPVRKRALTIASGTPYWYVYDEAGGAAAAQVLPGVTAHFGESLVVRLPYAELAGWIEPGAERQVCVYSQLDLEGALALVDRGGCVSLASDAFTTYRASVPAAFGHGHHELELSIEAASYTTARAAHLSELGLTALVAFERALGRPLFERSRWPVHVYLTEGGSTAGTASAQTGAHVSIDRALEGAPLDYLFVEQLARLAMADLLEREAQPLAYWIQEFYVQWLTASAMYDVSPSADVHDFHAGRIDDYLCFVEGACPTLFSSDVPLSQWTKDTLGSTGSVKSLIFMLVVDAKVGGAAVARALGVFDSELPDAATLARRLKAFAADAELAREVDALFERFVTSNGEIASLLTDADGDGLLRFEEDKLGTSDAAKDPYLASP